MMKITLILTLWLSSPTFVRCSETIVLTNFKSHQEVVTFDETFGQQQQGKQQVLSYQHQEELETAADAGYDTVRKVSQSTCITEQGLDLHSGNLVMAPTEQFPSETFAACLSFCMESAPELNHILVNFYNALLAGDKFNCMCANEAAFQNTTAVASLSCNVACPQSNYKCGNAKNNLLSAYCIQRDCSSKGDLAPNYPICAKRLPHDIHGCIKHDFIDWDFTHNVRNFSLSEGKKGNTVGECIWECRDNHMGAIFALTRLVANGDVLTCSCGFSEAFNLDKMVSPEFCALIPNSNKNDFYSVNCVTDLDEDGGDHNNRPNGTSRCSDSGPVGCMYKEIVDTKPEAYDKFIVMASASKKADVSDCLRGCQTLFPDSYYAAIRKLSSMELECYCLMPNAFNSSLLGPDLKCNQFCGQPSLGFLCGSNEPHPSLSLYCLFGQKTKLRQERSLDVEDSASTNGTTNSSFLASIHHALEMEKVNAEIMVGLLTLLCIVLTTAVVYLCYTRGISSLSRYVM